MSGTVSLEREASEKLELPVTTADDPTSFTVEWATTNKSDTEARPSTWTAGTWKGAATSASGGFKRTAVTPILALALGAYTLWVRVTASGGEVAVEKAGTVKVV